MIKGVMISTRVFDEDSGGPYDDLGLGYVQVKWIDDEDNTNDKIVDIEAGLRLVEDKVNEMLGMTGENNG